MKELVIISGKGGTGKTSITGAFAVLAKNKILADCDVDAADLFLLLEPEIKSTEPFVGGKIACIETDLCTTCNRCREICRFDAITTDYHIDPLSCEGCGVCVWNCPADAIRFEPRISGDWMISDTRCGPMVHAKLGIAEENSGKLVTMVRKQARQLAQARNMQWLLVDGPPGSGCPVIAAIGHADYLLIVTEPSLSAIHDMQRVVQLARHFEVPAMVCINKSDINLHLTTEIKTFCRDQNLPLVGILPYSRSFTLAQLEGKSIVEYDDPDMKSLIRQLWDQVNQEIMAPTSVSETLR